MKEILLVRHGKPASAHNQKVNAVDYAKWVRNYNKSELDPNSQPRKKVCLENSYIGVSPLHRAKCSAAHYGASHIHEELADLREMDIPYYHLPFTLKAWHWVVISRALWFLGRKGRFERFADAKQRIERLAVYLDTLSKQEPRIVLFGHGMAHYFLRKSLVKQKWRITEKDGEFWGVTRLEKM